MIINCWNCNTDKEHYAKALCRSCYRKLSGEGNKYYNKHKDDLKFKEQKKVRDKKYVDKLKSLGLMSDRWRKAYIKYSSNPINKLKKKIYNDKWRKEINPDAYKNILKRSFDNRYFNGVRKLVFERDGNVCFVCKMTSEEHQLKWKSELTIHHLDGNGRHVDYQFKNNNLNNLVALCKSCHGKVEMGAIKILKQ